MFSRSSTNFVAATFAWRSSATAHRTPGRCSLDELDLADKVDEVVLSCDVGSAKPDAAIYLKAIDMLGVDAADAIFVDDQPSYVSGAEALGIRSVLIDRRGRTPGAVQSLDQVMELV